MHFNNTWIEFACKNFDQCAFLIRKFFSLRDFSFFLDQEVINPVVDPKCLDHNSST